MFTQKRYFLNLALCLSTLAFILMSIMISPVAQAQTSDGFSPLFTDEPFSDWTYEEAEQSSFSFDDEVLKVQGAHGWLRSPREYGNFTLRLQFRFTAANADSGVFFRAGTDTPFFLGWPGDAYQVQIREISENQSDNPLPLANLYRHRIADGETSYERAKVFEIYQGVDQWHDIEISVIDDLLNVTLNGELVNTSENIVNARGYIGFQSEAGTIEYRNIMIRESLGNL